MDGPTELGQLLLDVGERVAEGGAAVGAGGAFGENAFALQFKGLPLALALCLLSVGGCGVRFGGWGLELLFFHGFALPSS